ncbi:sulfotransferase [Panacibacter ginsenosidivorans]|uniref:Sulfotransferase n=1 Tax=Panacibacter ginsenosidivorans TaxID=1813871 RepID=A0A5B8VE97_9BACT|nr:sulfotransferase [Panacibacter ginsenosidivorans]QEC69589.1 sulfotransferase [Panacibacter ginsenosidivorans]
MTKFIVFTTPRTGSTLLVKSLDRHPEIFCAGEIFLLNGTQFHGECSFPFWKLPLPKKAIYIMNFPNMWMNLSSFLKNFFTPANGEKAKGFKMMHFQTFYVPGMIEYIKKNDIKVILLLRENLLKNTLSDLRARDTGVYHNSGNVAEKLPKFNVDIPQLEKKMEEIAGIQKELENVTSSMNTLKITYEDFENWDATISKVLNFINVENIQLPPVSKKLNPDKLEDMIENYDEMAAWLKQKNYAHFLD